MQAWRADWNRFVRDVFGVTLDAEQQAILSSVQHNPRTSVVSGTARGKDFVAACAALCFLYLTPSWNTRGELVGNTKVALTAPTDRQVLNIMIPEISRLYNKAKARGVQLIGKLNAHGIQTDNKEWFLTGFKADENNHEAWSGFHAVNTMFVVTEGSGISDSIFEAIEGNLQGNSRILVVFNGNRSTGYAARTQKSERWERFRLNSLTAPNVLQHRISIAGQVDYPWIIDKLEQWCIPITQSESKAELDDFEFEGKWYRPEDLFRIKVLGLFPKVGEDVLIPPQWLEAAHDRWREAHGEEPSEPYTEVLGVDVAGMGRDCTVFCRRKKHYVAPFRCLNSGESAEHMKIAGEIHTERRARQRMFVSIDTIGEGAGVYSRCLETDNRAYILSCKFSEAAKDERDKPLTDVTGQRTFANLRAYLFWAARDWLDPKNNTGAMLPPDDMFDAEATEIRWTVRSSGAIIIEPKEDIKKRLGRSTDRWDAFANTFIPVSIKRPIDTSMLEGMIY